MASFSNLDREWSVRVNRVFDTEPRDGGDPNAIWLPRSDIENHFSDLLFQDGVHICVDGPSGTGKSSLVLTQLRRAERRVIPIQLTTYANWTDLCREIIGDLAKADSKFSLEAAIGADALPHLKLGYNRQNKGKADNLTLWKAIGSQINEWDLSRALQALNAVLVIDDFEKANQEIVIKIADTCKLMTQSYKGKIVIVGTNDIYFRLMCAEPSLENRLVAMSIGALTDMEDGWNFLCMSFDSLGIMHPGKIYNERSLSGADNSRNKLHECKVAIHDAAATLPKALNEFGQKVCLNRSQRSPTLSLTDLMGAARDMVHTKVKAYIKNFPEARIVHKPEVRIVLCAIYDRTIGSILQREDIYSDAAEAHLSRDQFDEALKELVDGKIITQTGRNGETLFITKPHMAHIFGVCVKKYAHYRLDPNLFGPLGQLSLPLKNGPIMPDDRSSAA